MDWTGWLRSEQQTELYQLVFAFLFGLLAGPLADGWAVTAYLIFTIVYEVLLLAVTEMQPKWWRWEFRVAVNAASFSGWMLGRWLFHDETGVEELDGLPGRILFGN